MSRRVIYLVETGEYSSYGVECAFESKEDAQAAVDAGHGDTVSELVLFGSGEFPKRTTVHWEAHARCAHDSENPPGTYPPRMDLRPRVRPVEYSDIRDVVGLTPTSIPAYVGRPQVRLECIEAGGEVSDPSSFVGFVDIIVIAATREEALKVCSDLYAKRRAQRDGL